MIRYFTTSEANAVLPDVARKFEVVMSCREEISKIERQMQAGGSSLAGYMEAKQMLNSALTRFHEAMEALEATGVAVKDIQQGLLDFPSKRFDQEVWLCWKYGEDGIRFWHEIDSGFMGRKPIEVSDESLV